MTQIEPPRTPEEKSLQQQQQQQKEGDSPPAPAQGFDPSSGLYFYHDGAHPTMYMDPNVGQWCYWNEEGRFFYPVSDYPGGAPPSINDASANAAAASEAAAAAADSSSSSSAATLGPPRTGSGSQQQHHFDPFAQHQVYQQQGYPAVPAVSEPSKPTEAPLKPSRPLPFRLTSASQSQRERMGMSQQHQHQQPQHNVRKRLDWATAFGDNGPDRGSMASRFTAAPSYLSNPPLLPPRFYYPHAIAGTYYDFLNVRPTASVEEVEESVGWWETIGYKKASAADSGRADRIHRLVMEAAIIISNSSLRAQYDLTLPVPGASQDVGLASEGPDAKKHQHQHHQHHQQRASAADNKHRSSSSSKLYGRGPDGLLDVSNYVPRVVHLHSDDGARTRGTNSAVTSLSNTPSKYGGGKNAFQGSSSTGNNNGSGNNEGDFVAEEDDGAPSISERLFAAVSEGIFGPPRARPRNKKYVDRGAEWLEVARRALEEGGEEGADGTGAGAATGAGAGAGGKAAPGGVSNGSSAIASSTGSSGVASAQRGAQQTPDDQGAAPHAGAFGATPEGMSPPPVGPPL